jgi:endogenous inhibitor of DNA gyrase (YacG/DUF329 family)
VVASRTSICPHCGERVGWGKSVNNRPQPIDADGTVHFATCKAMKRTEKAFPADCAACGSENLDVRPGTGPHAGALYCIDCGRFIKWLSKNQYRQITGEPHAAAHHSAPEGA